MPSTSLRSSQVQQLFVGASWALAHGDAGGFAQVVSELAQSFTGELKQELLELSRQCHVDYDTAAERWPGVCARAPMLPAAQPARRRIRVTTPPR